MALPKPYKAAQALQSAAMCSILDVISSEQSTV